MPAPRRWVRWVVALIAAASVGPIHVSSRFALAGKGAILLLTGEETEASVQPERFLLTLRLQLHPYSIEILRVRLTMPPSLAAQVQVARERAKRSGVAAVVWCTRTTDQAAAIHVLDLRQGSGLLHTLAVGAPEPGVERSLAVAVRTLLLADPLEVQSRPPPPAPSPARPNGAPSAVVVAAAAPLPRLQIGVGYSMDGYPLGRDLRHGPNIGLGIRLWRRVEGQLVFGYRLPRRGIDGESEWSRSDWRLSCVASTAWVWRNRWEILVGPRIAVTGITAEAKALGSQRAQSATLWEVSLGATSGLILRLGPRFGLELTTVLAWLPVRHSLMVRGLEVASSGSLEFSLGAGLRAGFF